MKIALIVAALIVASQPTSVNAMATSELNTMCESTYQLGLHAETINNPPYLDCARIIIGLIDSMDKETIGCLNTAIANGQSTKDINSIVKYFVFLLHTTEKIDNKFGELSADEAVFRVMHVRYCKDKRPYQ